MKLWQKILIGLTLGVLVGAIFKDFGLSLKPIGDVFINAIKMLIVPLIFFSIIAGVTSMSDPKTMGRIGLKAMGLYVFSTMGAIALGLGMGQLIKPGAGFPMQEGLEPIDLPEVSLLDTFINIVPTNPIESMADGNVLQIIFFAIMVGVSAALLGKKSKAFTDWNESMAEIMYKMTGIIMKFAPYGVFALMAWVTASYGLDVLIPLSKVIAAVYIGCILQIIFVYGGAIKFVARLSPKKFFSKIINAQSLAFTTCSSSATLPMTIQCTTEKMGVSKGTASFALPLGATVNMNGSAIYHGVCVMFIAQVVGQDLVLADYITVIITSTLVSIGVAGVPGGGLVTLAIVFNSVGLPTEAVALIAGIDRILDMARTTVNVTGDAAVSVIVDKSEKHLDEGQYNL